MRQVTRALIAAMMTCAMTLAQEATSVDLFDPSSPEARGAFVVVNDSVMGGVSSSRVSAEGDALVFSGTVRLENNGGFASMRASTGTMDLRAFSGIELVVRGDGQRYKLNLRDEGRFDGVVHRVGFDTRAGEVLTLRFPFDDFEPTFRGRRVPGSARLDVGRIQQIGMLISDKQAGEFRLELLAVRAYE